MSRTEGDVLVMMEGCAEARKDSLNEERLYASVSEKWDRLG